MSAKHINKYDFTTQEVLATDLNQVDKQENKLAFDDSEEKGADTETTRKESVESSTEFQYPPAWKDKLPKFPFVPQEEEEEEEEEVSRAPVAAGWEDGQMPVFPFSSTSAVEKTQPQK